ncbi:MAG: orotidine-5'-phosphate decarboxylase [Verrucomicrobiales bacterium]|nr:orotidine-5'-phosphate decarboxylase [Verrucomicrobiales bacterium]
MTYSEKLAARIESTGSNLCVGIDPRPELTGGDLESFVYSLVEQTEGFAAAFKPNSAYFEAEGSRGYAILERLVADIPDEVPVILDVKRGDIGATQSYYAKACFECLEGVDAVTVNPYMGFDSVEPMLSYPGRAVYLLGVTSNPGAKDIELQVLSDGRQVFELVAEMASRSSEHKGEVGFVVGLTNARPDILEDIPDVPLLLPGLGAQGGDLDLLRDAGRKAPVVINVSRGVMAGEGTAAERARSFRDRISAALA